MWQREVSGTGILPGTLCGAGQTDSLARGLGVQGLRPSCRSGPVPLARRGTASCCKTTSLWGPLTVLSWWLLAQGRSARLPASAALPPTAAWAAPPQLLVSEAQESSKIGQAPHCPCSLSQVKVLLPIQSRAHVWLALTGRGASRPGHAIVEFETPFGFCRALHPLDAGA